MSTFKYYSLASLILLFLIVKSASAAVVYVLPEEKNFSSGEIVSVDIKIDSEGESINAIEGTIEWPTNILEFVSVTKKDSVFDFWLEEPIGSSASSSLRFVGGTTKGISGAALHIVNIQFKTVSAGTAELLISEVAVTASDGKGTNVFSGAKGARYGIGLGTIPVGLPDAGFDSEVSQEPAPQPVPVERKAIPAEDLPQKPEIRIPQYAEQKEWYNYLGEVVVLWDVPPDITSFAFALNHSPNTVPIIAKTALTTGRSFGILEDGIWYIHVRFRNNIGWGPVQHQIGRAHV